MEERRTLRKSYNPDPNGFRQLKVITDLAML